MGFTSANATLDKILWDIFANGDFEKLLQDKLSQIASNSY